MNFYQAITVNFTVTSMSIQRSTVFSIQYSRVRIREISLRQRYASIFPLMPSCMPICLPISNQFNYHYARGSIASPNDRQMKLIVINIMHP